MPETRDATAAGTIEEQINEQAPSDEVSGNADEIIKRYTEAFIQKIIDTSTSYKDDLERGLESLRQERDQELENTRVYTEKEIDKLKDRVSSQEIKIIQTLGIFVALFTFISVNIQIFSKVSDLLSASLFSVILAALTGIIILTILLVTHSYETGDMRWWVKFISLIVLFIALLTFGLWRLSLNPELHSNVADKARVDVKFQKENSEDQKAPQVGEQVQQ